MAFCVQCTNQLISDNFFFQKKNYYLHLNIYYFLTFILGMYVKYLKPMEVQINQVH